MNLIASISGMFRRQESAPPPATEAKSLNAWPDMDDRGTTPALNMGAAHTQSTWIYSCVGVLAESVANIPFRFSVGGRKGEKRIESGDLVNLFENPHPLLTRFDFWELMIQWLMLRGRCFVVGLTSSGEVINWAFTGGTAPKPAQLLILNPDRIRRDVRGGELLGWFYTATGINEPMEGQYFLPTELIYLRLPMPGAFWDGASPLWVATMAAQSDYYAAAFMKGMLANNADTGLVIGTEQKLSPEQRTQIEAAVRARKRMAGRADKPLILEGGLKSEKPSVSSADMQFLENRKFNRQEICAVFRVPQEIIGFTEDANRSVGESARLNFIENRVIPLCERIEARMQPAVRVFGREISGWFDADSLPIMQAAKRARTDVALRLFTMGVPFNDINQSLELGFPEYDWHRVGYLPFSVNPVGGEPQEPAEPEVSADQTDPSDQSDPSDPSEAAASKLLRIFTPKTGGPGNATAGTAAEPTGSPAQSLRSAPSSQAFAAATAGSARLKKGKLQRFFFEQRLRVLAKLPDAVKAVPLTRGIEDIFDLIAENKILWQRFSPILRTDLEFGIAQISRELGVDLALPPADAIAFLDGRANMVQGVNSVTFDALKSSLAEGLASGETNASLVDRVKTVYADADQFRAETIATTETNIAVNSGRFAGMRQANVPKKGWRTSHLDGTRATHIAAERDYTAGIPVDDPFIVGGEELQHPGDPAGSAKEVINCRCFTYAILDKGAAIPARFLSYEEFLGRAGRGAERAEMALGATGDQATVDGHTAPEDQNAMAPRRFAMAPRG